MRTKLKLASIAKALEVEVYELFVFKETIPYDDLRQELLTAMEDDKKSCICIKCLKGTRGLLRQNFFHHIERSANNRYGVWLLG